MKLTERFREMAEVPKQIHSMGVLSVIATIIAVIALLVAALVRR